MREFLLKKNLWVLDLFSAVVFALCMSAFVQIRGDSGQKHLDKILYAMFFGVLSYSLAFVLALFLRKKLTFIRSWAWLGIVGALVQILIRRWRIIPDFWPEYREVSATTYILLEVLPWVIVNWIFWAIPGCVFIFIMRFIAYSWANKGRPEENSLP
jgi:uncharacterized YccA/Bax inhibitor family protein